MLMLYQGRAGIPVHTDAFSALIESWKENIHWKHPLWGRATLDCERSATRTLFRKKTARVAAAIDVGDRNADGGVHEGEWKAGKWHGRGKETYADGAVYEGEFQDDKQHERGERDVRPWYCV